MIDGYLAQRWAKKVGFDYSGQEKTHTLFPSMEHGVPNIFVRPKVTMHLCLECDSQTC